jgi:hypothetical protein
LFFISADINESFCVYLRGGSEALRGFLKITLLIETLAFFGKHGGSLDVVHVGSVFKNRQARARVDAARIPRG